MLALSRVGTGKHLPTGAKLALATRVLSPQSSPTLGITSLLPH